MTWQLKSLTLYGRTQNQVRTLEFRLSGLNIVTGDSRTGKTSIWTIIDYCTGSDDYPVRAGVVRDYVAVFALQLVRGERQLFVARPAPKRGTSPVSRLCLQFQELGSEPPTRNDLVFTFTVDVARNVLSEFCGIDRTVRLPGSQDNLMTPSIRHALFFCIQAQNDVANPDHLFDSQRGEWRPQAIRDVFPYFLGAVDPEQAIQHAHLRQLRIDLRSAERALDERQDAVPASGQALALVREAFDAGLLPEQPLDALTFEDARDLLNATVEGPALQTRLEIQPNSEDPLSQLDWQRQQLRLDYQRSRARLSDLRQSLVEGSDYLAYAADQRERLASLDLLRISGDGSIPQCPICGSEVPSATDVVLSIREDLARLDSNVVFVSDDTPQIHTMIDQEEENLRNVRQALARNRDERESLEAGLRATARFDDDLLRAAAVYGRISLFLENSTRFQVATPITDIRAELRTHIAELETVLGEDVQNDRVESSVSLINQKISAKARELELEHSDVPIRLDTRRLTIVADTDSGPILLSEVGSGENSLGYHIATLLSLHEWFTEHHSPVPRVLVLDQPSRIYFPADYKSSGLDSEREADRILLLRVYEVIAQTIDRLGGGLQVIVMEHADLDEDVFRSGIVERWRRDEGNLIPNDWINTET